VTQLLFCQNFVKSPPNLIIFRTQIGLAKTIEICKICNFGYIQMSLKDPLLSVSLFCHLASIILCALILSETLALHKSFTYLHLLSLSFNLCHRTTVLKADALNCCIMLICCHRKSFNDLIKHTINLSVIYLAAL